MHMGVTGLRIVLSTAGNDPVDVTEAVQIIYDALHASMDFGSGLLDTAEVQALRRLSMAAGWEPITYNLDRCRSCGHQRNEHITRNGGLTCLTTVETAVVPTSAPLPEGWKIHQYRAMGEPGKKWIYRECGCSEFVLDLGEGEGEEVSHRGVTRQSTALPGHGLLNEGAAYTSGDCTEDRCYPGSIPRRRWEGTSGRGHALCSCGAESPHLNSGNQRKRWHREHKMKVRAELGLPDPEGGLR